nr:proprotein convertase subtilisin/kexin type 5-like [Penaeus vannamei]XP_027210201.1 proprotein convertase subtilisin/kexin type 5-like [Penaeus vannamei]
MLLLLLLLALRGQPGAGEATSDQDYVAKLREQFEYFKQLILHDLASRSDATDFADYDLTDANPNCEQPATITCSALDEIPHETCACIDVGYECDVKHKGECKLSWQRSHHCDFFLNDTCNSDCRCCIRCSLDVQTECKGNGGNCRKKCGQLQRESNFTCHSELCRCCHPIVDTGCKAENSMGHCVGDPSYCGRGYYTNDNLCADPGTTCCVPCMALDSCIDANGYCESYAHDCLPGYYEEEGGCESGNCRCCKPETATCSRKSNANYGRGDFCSPDHCPRNYYQSTTGCEDGDNTCYSCKPGSWRGCVKNSNCSALEGFCSKKSCEGSDIYIDLDGGCESVDGRQCFCCYPRCKRY